MHPKRQKNHKNETSFGVIAICCDNNTKLGSKEMTTSQSNRSSIVSLSRKLVAIFPKRSNLLFAFSYKKYKLIHHAIDMRKSEPPPPPPPHTHTHTFLAIVKRK